MTTELQDPIPAEATAPGFDADAMRNKYREERDKRIRSDGNEQYVEVKAEFAHYVDDPYVEPGFAREPLTDDVEVVVIGGGFGGLLAGARLREAGAVILGKSNMHELASGITTIGSLGGQTLNPYDLTRNPGGSSGGTGAAIAASFAAIGWGSDTCGSIRIPSSHNNLVGLRPT